MKPANERITPRSLIDKYMPAYDWVERHSLAVLAPPRIVYEALHSADFAKSPLVRALLELRAIPARLTRSHPGSHDRASANRASRPAEKPRAGTLASFRDRGFTILEERPGEEMLIGLIGRFWTPSGGICATNSERFRAPLEDGTARAAWNFTTIPMDGGDSTLLSTETRIEAADVTARRSFARYWLLIRPFSGLIRKLMLRAIRDEAESAAARGKRQ
ncbi:MAG: hypothetical protein H7Z74_00720 [Anaerolineae bacterium]|nr:hypothetical protein [Gemmatimonadaceae bacterium]